MKSSNDLTTKNPVWCFIPIAFFVVLTLGDARAIAAHQPIRSFADLVVHLRGDIVVLAGSDVWLTREVASKAISLFLFPLSMLAAFVSLWPFRDNHPRAFEGQGQTPPLVVEPAALLLLFGGGYVHYFLGSASKCAFCPGPGVYASALVDAGALFVLSFIPYGIAAMVYTRLNFNVRA